MSIQQYLVPYYSQIRKTFRLMQKEHKRFPVIGAKPYLQSCPDEMRCTAYRMYWREQVTIWTEELNQLRDKLLLLVKKYAYSQLPENLHHPQIKARTIGHYFLGVEIHLQRDMQRIVPLMTKINSLPLGANATDNESPAEREYIMRKLGFDHLIVNPYDAIGSIDDEIECSYSVLLCLHIVSRFLCDCPLLAFGYSMKNSIQHLREKCTQAIEKLSSVAVTCDLTSFALGSHHDEQRQYVLDTGMNESIDVLSRLNDLLSNPEFSEKGIKYDEPQNIQGHERRHDYGLNNIEANGVLTQYVEAKNQLEMDKDIVRAWKKAWELSSTALDVERSLRS